MKCKYCGKEFSNTNKRGRKKEYCNSPDCIRKAKNEAQRKWYAGKTKCLEGTKYRVVEQKEETKVIYSSADRIINNTNCEDFSDVLEYARQLGAIRFEILEKIKSLSPEQSKYDKADNVFLHDIENLLKKDVVYEKDVVDVVKDYICNRPDRRVIKDKQEMLRHLIQGLISNPNQYVVEFIKKRNTRVYNPNKIEKVGGNQ